jgi:intraflagellar transport protein 56
MYTELLALPDPDPTNHTYMAACLFYEAKYAEAEEAALKGPATKLQASAPRCPATQSPTLQATRGLQKQRAVPGWDSSGRASWLHSSGLGSHILFHCAHKFNDESKLMTYHQQLTDSTEDQLSLASIHYHRSHFQEATDIYKRLLLENREFLALNVYVALCYCKLDYYDVSLEILAVYLQARALEPACQSDAG